MMCGRGKEDRYVKYTHLGLLLITEFVDVEFEARRNTFVNQERKTRYE